MGWQHLIVEPEPGAVEPVEEWLFAAGAMSVTLEDARDQPLLEPAPGTTPLWRNTRLVGLFPATVDLPALAERLRRESAPDSLLHVSMARLDDRIWELEWRRDYSPMRFGRRLWVLPPDAAHELPAGAVGVLLEPGLAFGTGTHPTTALCLRWLDACPAAGPDVLDYGCGSGILAIAAARLGAREVIGTDIDPQALEATIANARRNGCEARIHAVAPADLPPGAHDLVVANILAGTLSHLAPELAARTRPGGDLVLSGLLTEQADGVISHYRPWFEFQPPASMGEWCLLHGVRRRDAAPIPGSQIEVRIGRD